MSKLRHLADPTPRYAFIDGNCFLTEWRNTIQRVHGNTPDTLDLAQMRTELGATRLYWYDSLAELDSVRQSESIDSTALETARLKLSHRRKFLEHLQNEDGFIVRTGTSRVLARKGRVETREKEVDVLLAVDSLLHAANGNMKHALIFGSDLDHRPVVEALMQLGVYVTVYGHGRTSGELRISGDSFRALDYFLFYEWSDYHWRQANPGVERSGRMSGGGIIDIDFANTSGGRLVLQRFPGHHTFQAFVDDDGLSEIEKHPVTCRSKDSLLRYLEFKYGVLDWQNGSCPGS